MRRSTLATLLLACLLPACGTTRAAAPLPTANLVLRPTAALVMLPTSAATPTLAPPPTPTPAPPAPTPATIEAQYRAWIEEARAAHPYAESSEQMWAVMQCESGGIADISNGINIGLFQYHPDTWAGTWNPYRDQPITDARAQIFATAKAWQEGHQGWWGCYGRAAEPDMWTRRRV